MVPSDQAAVVVPPRLRVALPTTAAVPTCSAPPLPDGPCPVCPRLAAEFEPYRQAAYWKAMHQRALARQGELQTEIDTLRAQLRLRQQQLFGKKSEARSATSEANPATKSSKPRGQQRGQPGPPRRDHSPLPAVVEDLDLPADQQRCCCGGLPLDPFPGTEDGEILEVEVEAHRRV
jgi:hypothetical protein